MMIAAQRATAEADVVSAVLSAYRVPEKQVTRKLSLMECADVCFADALQGRRCIDAAGFDTRQDVLLGLLVGDTIGATSEGLHPNRVAPFCRDLVPWPFVSVGSESCPVQARGTTHVGAQALLTLKGIEDMQGSALDVKAVERRLQEWALLYHSTVFDAKTMTSLSRLLTGAHCHKGDDNDFDSDPNTTSDASLSRNAVVSLAIDTKLAALTATVRCSLLTHSHPLEVLCCVVQTELLQSALHLRHFQAPSREFFATFLTSPDPKVSPWAQWKSDTDDPICRAWLAKHADALPRYEARLSADLGDVEKFNPFFAAAADDQLVAANTVAHTLKTALWALHWSCVGHFPPHLLGAWMRHEDYDAPIKYRTRIEKERKMARAGLVPCVRKDHPGGNVWNPLDAAGRFHAVMWVALAGGPATSACVVAGALLAAYHGTPSNTWLRQVKVAPQATEMLRRVVGDACNATEAPPTWLQEVAVPNDERIRLARMVNYHIRLYEQQCMPDPSTCLHPRRPLEHEVVEDTTALSLFIPTSFTELQESVSIPYVRVVRHRRDPDPPAFEECCTERVGDPLDIFSEQVAQGRSPVVVYCADPLRLLGDFMLEATPVGENQLFKRTTACLALWRRRKRDDARLSEEANLKMPSREPAYPLTSSGVVYVPRCLLCKDSAYQLLPPEERICCSVMLMSHHHRDHWEMSEPRIIRKRMQNALEAAVQFGHDCAIVPSFGYSFVEHLSPQHVLQMWIEEASCFRHALRHLIVVSPMDPVTGERLETFLN